MTEVEPMERAPAPAAAAPPVADPLAPAVDAGPDAAASTRTRTRGALVFGAVLIVVIGAGGLGLVARSGGARLAAHPEGAPAPLFTLPLLDEGTLRLASLRGRPVMLNFWASWCGPCKDEAPTLAAGWKRWRDRGVLFFGVDEQDSKSYAIEFQARYGIEYPSAYDAVGETQRRYGVAGFPESFFIGADGRIKAKWIGPIDAASLDQNLELIVDTPHGS